MTSEVDMRGSDIIRKLGVNQAHCLLGKEMLEIDPERDYAILRGTDEHPRVLCEHHEKMVGAGKYPRVRIEGREVINDGAEWSTGHNAFEGLVEPRFSPERETIYMVQ